MLTLSDVLPQDDVRRVREGLANLTFRDGRATALGSARQVKSNRQTQASEAGTQALARFVRQALERHPVFMAWARPARWSNLIFSRYAPGDAYGLHTDAPFMEAEGGGRLRTDLSFTLFLSPVETYQGGALEVHGPEGARQARPEAGSAVIYATGALHQVTPVTKGERLACVGWIESQVRRADEREVLFDLERLRASLPDGEARLTADKAIGTLLRMWGEV
ncbi:Fe2+-dependent dioxygenase [Brevundimonas sp. 2R-24]|uniref:Fe2+-dependent dioxygenase n=1 Tax=Peiella sedimenti TaxID=3061083 RepID=A0ABT8SLB5_9CAUL|nr:Fe2+-dependent dioxygenase [Caulobacteraceae bacterium XZ-24]